MRLIAFTVLLAVVNALPNNRRANLNAVGSHDDVGKRAANANPVTIPYLLRTFRAFTQLSTDLTTNVRAIQPGPLGLSILDSSTFAPVVPGFTEIVTAIQVNLLYFVKHGTL